MLWYSLWYWSFRIISQSLFEIDGPSEKINRLNYIYFHNTLIGTNLSYYNDYSAEEFQLPLMSKNKKKLPMKTMPDLTTEFLHNISRLDYWPKK